MASPSVPLVLAEGDDLHVFPSIRSLESWIEAIDVGNGEFKGYDAQGRRLILNIHVEHARFLGLIPYKHETVRVRGVEPLPLQEELRDRIRVYFLGSGWPTPSGDLQAHVDALMQKHAIVR